jgi:large subunit ribosomal protein L18
MSVYKKIRNDKERSRLRRKRSIRRRVQGTAQRPRLSVFRSLKHIYVQAIDDTAGRVLATVSDAQKDLAAEIAGKDKKGRARAVGMAIGTKLRQQNIESVVFDRNGFIYHGRVQQVAEGAREAGLQF